jgi:5-methyltetrahydrofolate--homocysteine methyltransferase
MILSPRHHEVGRGAGVRGMVTRTKKAERQSQASKRTLARSIRHDPMYWERLLWSELRNRKLDGFKFKRQHPIGRYIVDFVCLERQLILELDGGIHKLKREADAARDAALQTFGYRTLRVTNEELMREFPSALQIIRSAL